MSFTASPHRHSVNEDGSPAKTGEPPPEPILCLGLQRSPQSIQRGFRLRPVVVNDSQLGAAHIVTAGRAGLDVALRCTGPDLADVAVATQASAALAAVAEDRFGRNLW